MEKKSQKDKVIHEFIYEFEAELDHNAIARVRRSIKFRIKGIRDRIKGFT